MYESSLGFTSNSMVSNFSMSSKLAKLTSTAWSGCFTKIGSTYTDYSSAISTATAADVPFAFTAVDDAIYFGPDTYSQLLAFCGSQEAVYDGTIVLEYYNGSAWMPITTTEDLGMDKYGNIVTASSSEMFKNPNEVFIWDPIYDQYVVSPGGSAVTKSWIRARVATLSSVNTTPILSVGYYLPNNVSLNSMNIVTGMFLGGNDSKLTIYNVTTLSNDVMPLPVYWELRAY
jgi:hypothetical protein